jgi:ankyrin repeat protein
MILDHGADPNARTESGRTPLSLACEPNPVRPNPAAQLATVKLLLAHGANPAIPDYIGVTPRQIAQRHGLTDIIATLDAHRTSQ